MTTFSLMTSAIRDLIFNAMVMELWFPPSGVRGQKMAGENGAYAGGKNEQMTGRMIQTRIMN
jgi:hypothetical protein